MDLTLRVPVGQGLLAELLLYFLPRSAGPGFSRALISEKSKSPLFPGSGGPWLQMTSALHG